MKIDDWIAGFLAVAVLASAVALFVNVDTYFFRGAIFGGVTIAVCLYIYKDLKRKGK